MPNNDRQVFDYQRSEFRSVEVLERNGNLSYVEYADGTAEWVSNQEVENAE